jgi:lipopolysaccharide export system permease protein
MKIQKCHIIVKFLAKNFLGSFSLVFCAVSGIIVLFSMISNTQSGAGRAVKVPLRIYFEFAVLDVFNTLSTTLPLCVLLGGILTFWRLSRTSELTVIRGVGISVWNFLAPILAVCALLGTLNMTVLNPIGAALQRRTQRLSYKYEISRANPMLFSQSGLWLKERSDLTQSFIYAEYIRKDGDVLNAKNLTIFVTDLNSHFLKRIEAASAVLKSKNLGLERVTMVDPRLFEEHFDRYDYPTSLTVDKIEENSSAPETFSFWELPGFIRFFEESGFSARKHRSHFYMLLFMPVMLCAMLFVAAVFAISPKRSQVNLVLKLSGGVLCGFAVFFIDQVVRAMGSGGRTPLFVSSLIVPVIAMMVCSTILLHNEDG